MRQRNVKRREVACDICRSRTRRWRPVEVEPRTSKGKKATRTDKFCAPCFGAYLEQKSKKTRDARARLISARQCAA